MATHEFGIMEDSPKKNVRYDEYEPEKYNAIKIHDDYLEDLLPQFESIPCYWHTLEKSGNNLDYCGVTLIPPTSVDAFVAVFSKQDMEEYQELISLFQEAKRKNKFIIHYGL